MRRRGLALILVVGVLAVMAVLGTAFVVLSRMERRASVQRILGTKALLLMRSGLEDAEARLALGQDPAFGGEDWSGNGNLDAGPETTGQVYQPGVLNIRDCPVSQALRPSFFKAVGGNPRMVTVESRQRGYSGCFKDEKLNWTLKVSSPNDRIDINQGGLGGGNRKDPDGPPAPASAFPLNPNAAPEVAPLVKGAGIVECTDISPEGPNGFLVRLLDNLETVVTGVDPGTLGDEVVGARPAGGYRSVEALKTVLTSARYAQFKDYLCVGAWIDPKTVKPQPTDSRPRRFEDVDDKHRIGGNLPATLAQMPVFTGATVWDVGVLNAAPTGRGIEGDPWVQTLKDWNRILGTTTYTVKWERQYLYAWRQLRLAPPMIEPREPICMNTATTEVLASVFLGLKGTYLEVWEGVAGWDASYGNTSQDPTNHTTPWPNALSPVDSFSSYVPGEDTEPVSWVRTRVDNGMEYTPAGTRPPYAPRDFDVKGTMDQGGSWDHGSGGKSMVQCLPLGRLRETPTISAGQAKAIAGQIRQRVALAGPFRTWADFNAFVDALPCWEDLNGDGILDGVPYNVTQSSRPAFTRSRYAREDFNGNGIMDNQLFPSGVSGLTYVQRDVIKAMANPNTDLNDFNPDANLWKEVDKTDVCGFLKPGPPTFPTWAFKSPGLAYVHTTELALDVPGTYSVSVASRVLTPSGRLLAQRKGSGNLAFSLFRDTTQADFMRDYPATATTQIFEGGWTGSAPYPLTGGGQPLVSYPEPQTADGAPAANARYDGQVSLGFVGQKPMPNSVLSPEILRASLFNAVSPNVPAGEKGVPGVPDLRGPYQKPLLMTAGSDVGEVFPDGVYSEKDACLRFQTEGLLQNYDFGSDFGGVTCCHALVGWVKAGWFPEASPGPHTLFSVGATLTSEMAFEDFYFVACKQRWDCAAHTYLQDDIPLRPMGMWFLPNRNSPQINSASLLWVSPGAQPYLNPGKGENWPRRTLCVGARDGWTFPDCLNLKGVDPALCAQRPIGRLQAHRWVHMAYIKDADWDPVSGASGGAGGICPGAYPSLVGRVLAGNNFSSTWPMYLWCRQADDSPTHLRFGEVSGASNMNYAADATFADIRIKKIGCDFAGDIGNPPPPFNNPPYGRRAFFQDGPPVLGRYFKEPRAAYRSSSSVLPPGARALRATWTEIPCELRFDEVDNGTLAATPDLWLDAVPKNDQFKAGGAAGANGKRDVRIDLEVWDDMGTPGYSAAATADDRLLGRFSDPSAGNPIPLPKGRLYYKAVFVNEWEPLTFRVSNPLDVTPFLDDVTLLYSGNGVRFTRWVPEAEE